MKLRVFGSHLANHDCELVREGGNHSWWGNRTTNRRSAVLRHAEVNDLLVKKICKDLGISEPRIQEASATGRVGKRPEAVRGFRFNDQAEPKCQPTAA